MIYKIEFSKPARKFILSRSQKEQQRILSAINNLPHGTDIKKIQGSAARYRLRVGDIRVIYEKFDDVLVIVIIDIGNRGDIYK